MRPRRRYKGGGLDHVTGDPEAERRASVAAGKARARGRAQCSGLTLPGAASGGAITLGLQAIAGLGLAVPRLVARPPAIVHPCSA